MNSLILSGKTGYAFGVTIPFSLAVQRTSYLTMEKTKVVLPSVSWPLPGRLLFSNPRSLKTMGHFGARKTYPWEKMIRLGNI